KCQTDNGRKQKILSGIHTIPSPEVNNKHRYISANEFTSHYWLIQRSFNVQNDYECLCAYSSCSIETSDSRLNLTANQGLLRDLLEFIQCTVLICFLKVLLKISVQYFRGFI